jgi:hypothetical protein
MPREYAYDQCLGTHAYRFGGERVCHHTQVRTDLLDLAVWREVRGLLEHPDRLAEEYRRRLHPHAHARTHELTTVEGQLGKMRQGLTRLIDSYAEGLIDKREFEPRIMQLRQRVTTLEEQAHQLADAATLHADLQLIIGRLEDVAAQVKDGLEEADWTNRRELIRALVKRVEVDHDQVNVVFRVDQRPGELGSEKKSLQDCRRRNHPTLWGALRSGKEAAMLHVARREHPLDERQHPAVRYTLGHQGHELLVVDRPKVILQVRIHDPLGTRVDFAADLAQRILGRSARPVAKAAIVKDRLKDRLQPAEQRLLTYPVIDRRDAQRACLSWPARLRDLHPSDRQGLVAVGLQLLVKPGQVLVEPLFELLKALPVDPAAPAVCLDLLPCHTQVLRLIHLVHQ